MPSLARETPCGEVIFTWPGVLGADDWPLEGAPEEALLPGAEGCDPLDVLVLPWEDDEVEEDVDDDDGDDVEVPLPEPAAEEPPELREAQPASAASTTAVLATVFTRGFIVLHLLARHWVPAFGRNEDRTGSHESRPFFERPVSGTTPHSPHRWRRRTGPTGEQPRTRPGRSDSCTPGQAPRASPRVRAARCIRP